MAEQGHQARALLGLLQWTGAGEEERSLERDRLDPLRLLSPLRRGRRVRPVLQSRQVHRQQRRYPQAAQFRRRLRRALAGAAGEHREEARRALRHGIQVARLLQSVHSHAQTHDPEYDEYARLLPGLSRCTVS